ncbi:MAG: dihydrodipicolinate synthase family protein [Bryobacterales bacterium]
MPVAINRRRALAALAGALPVSRALAAPSGKPMEGAFIIMGTPYKEDKSVDFDDLAGEVDFLDRSRVQGMVWPQMASEFNFLTEDERMQGMEVLAKAAKGKKPALVLGVQADTTDQMRRYARHAEILQPDAVIAMPPKQAQSLDDYREYYSLLCDIAHRPVFMQTTGGSDKVEPTVEFILELAGKHSNFGYIKEEYKPVIERGMELLEHKPGPIKAVFSGAAGRGWTYEMRLGFDGTMPGAMFADVYALIWELHGRGRAYQAKMREVFANLLLMVNLDQQIPGVRNYVFQKRGIFKTTVSRRGDYTWTDAQKAEINWNLEALKPYFRA